MAWPYILALGLAPGLAIMVYIFWKDKLNPEPLHLLLRCFLLGVLSIIPAFILELLFQKVFPGIKSGAWVDVLIYALTGVGLVEEGCKFYFLKRSVWRSAHFDEPFDGITYSVMVSMGFATAENIIYIFQAQTPETAFTTGILRAFTAVPAHASFAVLMGFFIGFARFAPHRSALYQLLGLGTATVFHGAYDFFLFTQEMTGTIAGAIISLILGVYFSYKAIQIHGGMKSIYLKDTPNIEP